MDPSAPGFTPAKAIDAGIGTNSVASPLESVKEGRPPKLKPKPEPPKNLSAMNLKMSEKDEEVAASVDTVLSETATKEEKHTCASKVGHAVKEGTWPAIATLGLTLMDPFLMTSFAACLQCIPYAFSATSSRQGAVLCLNFLQKFIN
jgi:hypothetical protein